MTESKNIWDILSNQELNIQGEANNLWALLGAKLVQDEHYYSYSFLDVARKEFLDFKYRGLFIDFDDFLQSLDLFSVYDTLEELDLLIEVILLILNEFHDINGTYQRNYDFSKTEKSLVQNIKLILEKTNQKIIEIEPNKKIVVPDDEVTTTVSDIILPENERLALSILGYSHYSNKENLEAKRKILHELANYIEPKLKKKKDSDISFVLNKYHIRHGDDENVENAEKLGSEKLNMLYDALYRDILYYLLGREHAEFTNAVEEMKGQNG